MKKRRKAGIPEGKLQKGPEYYVKKPGKTAGER